MAKARGIRTIREKVPVLKRLVAGVEYDTGELYYDRIGRVVRSLAKTGDGWIRNFQPAAGKTQILNPQAEMVFEVGIGGAVLIMNEEGTEKTIDEDDAARFRRITTSALTIATDELEIESYTRFSYREAYSFDFKSLEESEGWLKELGVISFSPGAYTSLGNSHYAMSGALVVAGEDCMYRMELRGVEKAAEVKFGANEMNIKTSRLKHLKRDDVKSLLASRRHRLVDPEFYVMVELEAFVWDRLDVDFDYADFLARKSSAILDLFRSCVSGSGGETR